MSCFKKTPEAFSQHNQAPPNLSSSLAAMASPFQQVLGGGLLLKYKPCLNVTALKLAAPGSVPVELTLRKQL